ncbi:polysialyltransferase family glycosyltransferase [Neolewinella sp.]|uniref:polysialyltransferase family glycosyltransferase n=1 Tax=Neolewinella sp. TaxID=2993543 RepID=UPI003B51FEF5
MKSTGIQLRTVRPPHLAILNSHVFHFVTLKEFAATRGHSLTDWFVFIYYESDRRDLLDVYKAYLEKEQFVNYRFFPIAAVNGRTSKWSRSKNIAAMLSHLLFRWNTRRFQTLLLGNYSSVSVRVFPNLLHYDELVYTDEGDSTLAVAKQRHALPGGPGVARLHPRRLLRFPDAATFFTRYKELAFGHSDRVIHCDYRHTLRRKRTAVNTHQVLFLGNPYPKYDYILEQEYANLVRRVAGSYQKQGISFLYKPHRMESENLLAALGADGIEIIRDGRPIEVYLGEMEVWPLHVASFLTTAFSTLASVFSGELKIVAYRLSKETFLKKQEHFTAQYAYYEEHQREMNIELVELPHA